MPTPLRVASSRLQTFFYPDCTVGTGFAPVPALGYLHNDETTGGSWAQQTLLHYHRSGIGRRQPHPALKVYRFTCRISQQWLEM